MIKRTIMFFVCFFAVGCQLRTDSQVSTSSAIQSTKTNSYIQELYNDKIDDMSVENIFLHEVLKKNLLLKKEEISNFLSAVAKEKFPLLEDEIEKLPSEIQQLYKDYKLKIHKVSEERIDNLANNLKYFATMPLLLVPVIQKFVFKKNKVESNQVDLFPVVPDKYTFKVKDCAKELHFQKEAYPSVGVYLYAEVLDKQINDCYYENSKVLSSLLNAVIKSQFDTTQDYTVVYAPNSNEETIFQVNSYIDFVNMISDLDFSLEIAATRMFVDFFGFYYKDPKTSKFLPIIFPSWFMHLSNKDKIYIPGEHGEIEVLISKNSPQGRQRIAGAKYYMGVPNESLPGHASFWRPRLYKRPQWYKTHVDTVFHASANAEVLSSIAKVTKHIHDIQNQFQLPMNSYGFYVCSDSVALATFDLMSQIDEYARLNQSFPLVRSDQNLLSLELSQNFHFTKEIMKKLNLSYEKFNEIYPPDYLLSDEQLRSRLESAFGGVHAKRFTPYFEFNYRQLQVFLKN